MPLWPFPFLNEAVIQLPSGETTHLTLRNDMTVMDVLTTVCEVGRACLQVAIILYTDSSLHCDITETSVRCS